MRTVSGSELLGASPLVDFWKRLHHRSPTICNTNRCRCVLRVGSVAVLLAENYNLICNALQHATCLIDTCCSRCMLRSTELQRVAMCCVLHVVFCKLPRKKLQVDMFTSPPISVSCRSPSSDLLPASSPKPSQCADCGCLFCRLGGRMGFAKRPPP